MASLRLVNLLSLCELLFLSNHISDSKVHAHVDVYADANAKQPEIDRIWFDPATTTLFFSVLVLPARVSETVRETKQL